MYIATGQGQTSPGDKTLMSTETSCHFSHLLQVLKKNLFEVWFYTHFFHVFIHLYSPRTGADNPLGTKFWWQQKGLITLPICCKFKKKSDWSLTLYIFFHAFIHVYSPRAGLDNPMGTKFWCQQKGLITLPICGKFQKILFKVDFKHIFSCFYTCI